MVEKIPNRIRPRANELVITANFIEVNPGKIADKEEQQISLDEYQTVLSKGTVVRDIEEGDVICLNPARFAKYQEQKSRVKAAVEGYEKVLTGYEFPIITTGYGNVMLIHDSDVKYIVEHGFVTYDPEPDVEKECVNYEEERCNTFSTDVATPGNMEKDSPKNN